MSKTYSVTGWRGRLGDRPADLTIGVRRVHDFLTVGAAAPLQSASVAGLHGRRLLRRLLAGLPRAARRPRAGARGGRVPRPPPAGAYYVMTDIRDLTDEDDVAFARR
jgi:aminotransferase